jgi:hypothetical protein
VTLFFLSESEFSTLHFVHGSFYDKLHAVGVIRPMSKWSAECPDGSPRILIDEVKRSPYNTLTEDPKGPLNQINIHTEGDHLDDLSERSSVVAALETYKAFRLYHADGDDETMRRINDVINDGVSKWPN